jgi:hypothetical protein
MQISVTEAKGQLTELVRRGEAGDDGRQLDALLTLRLTAATHGDRSLERVMGELRRKARERGLTPELLNTILDAPD